MIDLPGETVPGTSDLTKPGADNSLTSNPRFSLIPDKRIYSQVQITKKILFFVIFAFILLGCAPVERKEQPAHKDLIQLDGDGSLGQTFLSRYDGLSGISIYLKPSDQKTGELRLELLHNQIDTQVLRKATLEIDQVLTPGFHNFSFLPIKDSFNEDYYISLTFSGPGNTSIGSAPGKVYLNGALYEDGFPQNAQLAFKLEYSPLHLFLGLIREALYWLALLSAGFLLLTIPGWAALSWLFPPWSALNWIAKLGLAIGLGIAFYPLLYLWMNVLAIPIGGWFIWLCLILGLLFIVWQIIIQHRNRKSNLIQNIDSAEGADLSGENYHSRSTGSKIISIDNIPDLTFVLVMGLIVITRFWPIRSLDVPMWGDSYQHTLISQLLTENSGLFRSWQPYTQLSSFTYHFGFHTLVSSFHFLTGMGNVQATLWMGQIINIFAIFCLYPLALLVGKNRWAGVIAVLIAGMISPMPMTYINWGRYTQLTGQAILPAAIVIIWLNLEAKNIKWKWNLLVWIVLSGIFLTHYRIVLFIPLFYISFFILRYRETGVFNLLKRAFLHAVGAFVLVLPWLIRLFEGKLPAIYGQQITTPATQVSQAIQEYNQIGNIDGYLPIILWILVAASIIWGIWRRNKNSNLFSMWWLIILLAANPNWFGLPGEGILSNFAIFIAAYIPASILIGAATGSILTDYVFDQKNRSSGSNLLSQNTDIGSYNQRFAILSGLSLLLILGLGIVNIRSRLSDVQVSKHALVTRPDVRAAVWIDDHLPGNAKFLVNSFFAYGDTLVVGSDAGWWLPMLAKRETTQPPINYGMEQGFDQDFVHYTNQLISEIQVKGISHQDVLEELYVREVTNIYIGQQQGQVNANGPPLLRVDDLLKDPNFRLIYNQDRVWIFEVLRPEG